MLSTSDEQFFLSWPSLPGRCDPASGLAVLSLSSEPAQSRGYVVPRGIDVSYEAVGRWSFKFGLAYARKLRRSHPRADTRWHLDEVFASINGKNVYLWHAVDCEGEVLDVLVQSRRNKRAALKLMRKLLKSQGFSPDAVMTDELPSYGAALSELGMRARHIISG